MTDPKKYETDIMDAIDAARAAGCTLCDIPTAIDTFVVRVIAVHRACLEAPEPEDESEDEAIH